MGTRSTGNPRNSSEGAEPKGMTDKESPLSDIYTLLGVSQMSPMEGVRTRFYKLTRQIHRELAETTDIDRRNKLLYDLKFICIAYDILSDPVTRTDYDLRTMGLRGVAMPQTPDEKKPGELGQRLHLKIGELLNVAGLLETSELEIACDMHKAMPEMQFGSFLVKQGFIEEYQLEAVLFAQKLLRKGLITVVQYQAAMEELESSGVAVSETVVERGYVTQSDLDHLEEVEAEAQAELNRPVTTPVYTQPPLQPKIDEQVTSHSNLLAQMLPPGSPDVVSARASGNGEKSSGMLHKLLSGSQDGDITAPPATMGGLLRGGATASQQLPQQAPPPVPPQEVAPPAVEAKGGGRKRRNVDSIESLPIGVNFGIPASEVDPNLGKGEDVASDTYEGRAYKDELLKPVTGEFEFPRQPSPQSESDNFIRGGDGLFTASDGAIQGFDIMTPEHETASSDELGLIEAESSGVEFSGFVDRDEYKDEQTLDAEAEAEDDEGNITLIDSDGAARTEASIPGEFGEESNSAQAARDKTDSTHERIPAFAPSSALDANISISLEDDIETSAENFDVNPPTAAADAAESALEAPEPMAAPAAGPTSPKKEQSTTRDKIPAFRPPLHNTFQIDEDAQQTAEAKSGEDENAEVPQLSISNAVPSWKDQLDWSSPEETDEDSQQQAPSTTASQDSEPIVDISRHLDLEAIEPPQKETDDELKSFLGDEYREDLSELGESGRPLWDVEDDEFIIPSKKRPQTAAQGLDEAEERLAREKRASGGWQRLKNPFELQIDAQGASSQSQSSGSTTEEEAVVEVDENDALDGSLGQAAAYRNSFGNDSEVGAASTDFADSFVETSLEHEEPAAFNKENVENRSGAEDEQFDEQAEDSGSREFVDKLDESSDEDIDDDADTTSGVKTSDKMEAIEAELFVQDNNESEDYSSRQNSEESSADELPTDKHGDEAEANQVDEQPSDNFDASDASSDPTSDEADVSDESSADDGGEAEVESEQAEFNADDEPKDVEEHPDHENEKEAQAQPADEAEHAEEKNEDSAEEPSLPTDSDTSSESVLQQPEAEVAQPAEPRPRTRLRGKATPTSEAEVVNDEDTQAKKQPDSEDKEDEDATAGDDKSDAAAADASQETPLARRRRMLGRRHHRGK